MALAKVLWFSGEEGGRHEPPPGLAYAATAVFEHGGDIELIPGWPAEGEHFSVLLDFDETSQERESLAKVEFMARSLVADSLVPGSVFLIMEGPRPVARALVCETFDLLDTSSPESDDF
jgi:hypothetical protein